VSGITASAKLEIFAATTGVGAGAGLALERVPGVKRVRARARQRAIATVAAAPASGQQGAAAADGQQRGAELEHLAARGRIVRCGGRRNSRRAGAARVI
jgi:hypothetical protein